MLTPTNTSHTAAAVDLGRKTAGHAGCSRPTPTGMTDCWAGRGSFGTLICVGIEGTGSLAGWAHPALGVSAALRYISIISTYACERFNVVQSTGRPDSALGTAAADLFFSTLEHERISRYRYTTRDQARLDIATWIDIWYNKKHLHSANNMTSPIDDEHAY